MNTREIALHQWLETRLGHTEFSLTPLAGDASFRRYYRLRTHKQRRIVMDAPPLQEKNESFVHIAESLIRAGIRAPVVYDVDYTLGFSLLEDFGDELLYNQREQSNVDRWYQISIDTILTMQQSLTNVLCVPAFNNELILNELKLFEDWFLSQYLSLELTTNQHRMLNNTWQWLIESITSQPQLFVHRDYHSRNIMLIPDELQKTRDTAIGVIDFQGAVIGPWTYDLVSLLKDCYIRLSPERLIHHLNYFYQSLLNKHEYTLPEFERDFDLCGLQRHLKVLGIFCRLHFRDKKSAYLNDLPLVFDYVMTCLKKYEVLLPFYQFMQETIQPRFAELEPS